MGDVKGNPLVEIARVRMSMSNIRATIDRQKFEIIEMEDRKERNKITIVESEKLLIELTDKIKEMEKRQKEGDN